MKKGFESECVECCKKIFVPLSESVKSAFNVAICEECSKTEYECKDGYSLETIESEDINGDPITYHVTYDAFAWVCKEV